LKVERGKGKNRRYEEVGSNSKRMVRVKKGGNKKRLWGECTLSGQRTSVSVSSFEYSTVTLKHKNNNMNEMLNKIKISVSRGNVHKATQIAL
jgi:hypothetical protein